MVPVPARTHELGKLLGAIGVEHRDPLRRLFVEVSPDQAAEWREVSAYQYADWSLDRLVPMTHHMARTSIAVSGYAAEHFPGTVAARLIHKVAALASQTLGGWDLTAEDPYEIAGQPPPPEPR